MTEKNHPTAKEFSTQLPQTHLPNPPAKPSFLLHPPTSPHCKEGSNKPGLGIILILPRRLGCLVLPSPSSSSCSPAAPSPGAGTLVPLCAGREGDAGAHVSPVGLRALVLLVPENGFFLPRWVLQQQPPGPQATVSVSANTRVAFAFRGRARKEKAGVGEEEVMLKRGSFCIPPTQGCLLGWC